MTHAAGSPYGIVLISSWNQVDLFKMFSCKSLEKKLAVIWVSKQSELFSRTHTEIILDLLTRASSLDGSGSCMFSDTKKKTLNLGHFCAEEKLCSLCSSTANGTKKTSEDQKNLTKVQSFRAKSNKAHFWLYCNTTRRFIIVLEHIHKCAQFGFIEANPRRFRKWESSHQGANAFMSNNPQL